ncbi:hypothetical protein PCANC_17291 [Puccinia coronata f. sp. avenae]|uniref:Uncharacterized protein n=2 Tax=Puccinia coronata f. sp. avenae TaxID=200324 RepID=A0A2N5UIC4_9BASI|nr:hypothetical protein PCANC_17291 [Puccinia coronata f. sp. avenae]
MQLARAAPCPTRNHPRRVHYVGVLPIPKTAKLTRSSSSTGTINTSTSSPRREYVHAPESSFLPKRSSSLNNTANPILPLQPLVSSSTSNTSELDKMKNELNQFMASRYALCLWAINRTRVHGRLRRPSS